MSDTSPPPLDIPLHAVRPDGLARFLDRCSPSAARFLRERQFKAEPHSLILFPDDNGRMVGVLGLGEDRSPYAFGGVSTALPGGSAWTLAAGDFDAESATLGIALGSYRFERLKSTARPPLATIRVAPRSDRAAAIAGAICFGRDLINLPANRLGPVELADAATDLGAKFGCEATRLSGAALEQGFPALSAVGAGSSRPAQMVKFGWGDDPSLPLVSLCGKGVCFDSGGYDIKPSAGMLRMKKDMGGAAITLGLAHAIMALHLPVRLEVRIGCVENSISGHAMRPMDVLRTRKGLSVEVGNTDAEGRLVLADLLADAAAGAPHWLIDFATLTGAARVALGPDIPALFGNDDVLCNALLAGGTQAHDPLWRLPLWQGYDQWLDSPVADLNSVSTKPFAGAIVAALFLNRFVPAGQPWAHIDTYAWNDQTRPGRLEGGEAQALRGVLAAIESMALSWHSHGHSNGRSDCAPR